MSRHKLKTDQDVFKESWEEVKNFEIRIDDRFYKVGDYLLLLETVYTGEEMKNGKPLEYTGRFVEVDVQYKLSSSYGIKEGWCILSTSFISAEELIPEDREFIDFIENYQG